MEWDIDRNNVVERFMAEGIVLRAANDSNIFAQNLIPKLIRPWVILIDEDQ